MKFNELIKNENILKSLSENNFNEPTEIQKEVMPLINDGLDVLGQSQTGTGKTLAFSGPILDNIEENKITQTLILAPTRELALQIASDINKYAKYTNINVACVYGSSSIEEQIKQLKRGVEIVIGTPGRVMDLIKRKVIKLTEIKYFVLDEADEMLSMGFSEEIEFIFKSIHNDKQVLLFSATMPQKIKDLAENYMSEEYQTILVEAKTKTAENIEQSYYVTATNVRTEALSRVMDYYNFKRAMIFVRTKRNADELLEKLSRRGYSVNVIHGDISQETRIKTLELFKHGIFNYLIATDVAARGIHVDDVECVINYNLPESNEAYVHRIGRTGRANKKGMSLTFVTDREVKHIKELERYTKSNIEMKHLPKQQAIVSKKIESINEKLEVIKDKESSVSEIYNLLTNYTDEEIKNIIVNLLEERISSSFGADFTVKIDSKDKNKKKTKKRELTDSVRVFLTIGKLDDINKHDFLSYIEKKTGFKEGTCTGVEILSKFTFMNVKNDCYDKLFKEVNNTKYNNRLIRIEKAKK